LGQRPETVITLKTLARVANAFSVETEVYGRSQGCFNPWVKNRKKVTTLKAFANAFSVETNRLAWAQGVEAPPGLQLANAFGVDERQKHRRWSEQ
jgi:hypothetical protein